MAVLVACKNEEDPIKKDSARVVYRELITGEFDIKLIVKDKNYRR